MRDRLGRVPRPGGGRTRPGGGRGQGARPLRPGLRLRLRRGRPRVRARRAQIVWRAEGALPGLKDGLDPALRGHFGDGVAAGHPHLPHPLPQRDRGAAVDGLGEQQDLHVVSQHRAEQARPFEFVHRTACDRSPPHPLAGGGAVGGGLRLALLGSQRIRRGLSGEPDAARPSPSAQRDRAGRLQSGQLHLVAQVGLLGERRRPACVPGAGFETSRFDPARVLPGRGGGPGAPPDAPAGGPAPPRAPDGFGGRSVGDAPPPGFVAAAAG